MRKIVFLFFLLVSQLILGQNAYPELNEIVTDKAEIFSTTEYEHLKKKLTTFESETTNQLVLLTIDELYGEPIEGFANKTFNQNGLGQKGKDNGLLIVFVKNDRKVRIEVGRGLEPYITDALASRIIHNTMIPNFKDEAYFQGLDRATDQIIALLNDPEALEEFKAEMVAEDAKERLIGTIVFGLFLLIFLVVGTYFFYRVYRSLIEVFRGMLTGKLGVLQGVLIVVFSSFQIVFSLVFIVMPLVMFLKINDVDLTNFLDVFLELGTLSFALVAISIYGVAFLIALLQIVLKGKEDFKFSLYKSDKTYISKTFSSSGSHSFGSGSSSSGGFSGGGGSSSGGGSSGSW